MKLWCKITRPPYRTMVALAVSLGFALSGGPKARDAIIGLWLGYAIGVVKLERREPDEERPVPYPGCGPCTRQATLDGQRHICGIDGPCNGLPRRCQDCGAYPANCATCRDARHDRRTDTRATLRPEDV